jgi:hypothetical protein
VPFDPEELAVEFEKFPGREVVVKIWVFREEAEAFLGPGIEMRTAEKFDRPLVGKDQAEDAFERRRLARAVGPEVAEDLAFDDREGDALEDLFFLGNEADRK